MLQCRSAFIVAFKNNRTRFERWTRKPRPYVTAVDLEKEHILQVSVPLLHDEKYSKR